MKVLCKCTLYWHQTPGYSGMLTQNQFMDGKEGKAAMIARKKYEIVVDLGNDYVSLYALGEDGFHYNIMEDSLHCRASARAFDHFKFEDIKIRTHRP